MFQCVAWAVFVISVGCQVIGQVSLHSDNAPGLFLVNVIGFVVFPIYLDGGLRCLGFCFMLGCRFVRKGGGDGARDGARIILVVILSLIRSQAPVSISADTSQESHENIHFVAHVLYTDMYSTRLWPAEGSSGFVQAF